jgi:hypothetical protein
VYFFEIQKTIENFFTYDTVSSFSKQSERMRSAIRMFKTKSNSSNAIAETMAGVDFNLSEDEEENQLSQAKNAPTKPKRPPPKSRANGKKAAKNNDSDSDVQEIISDEEYVPKKSAKRAPAKRKSSESSNKSVQRSKQKK